MTTVTIPKIEYETLKRQSSAYFKIAEEITKDEIKTALYPYDFKYVRNLTARALKDFKKGKCVEADSVDKALLKIRRKK